MAPVAVAVPPAAHTFDKPVQAVATPAASSSRSHSALTSGQLEPDHSLIAAYEDFPVEVTGRTVWTREDYQSHESSWKWTWSAQQLELLEEAYTAFEKKNLGLTDVNQVSATHHATLAEQATMTRISPWLPCMTDFKH